LRGDSINLPEAVEDVPGCANAAAAFGRDA
jgi:hypothetical protein